MKETGKPEAFKAFQERPFVRAYVHAKTGDNKLKQGEYKAAIAHYDTAIELDPNIANAYTGRAAARAELWALGRAIADMRIARRLNRSSIQFFQLCGVFLMEAERVVDCRRTSSHQVVKKHIRQNRMAQTSRNWEAGDS